MPTASGGMVTVSESRPDSAASSPVMIFVVLAMRLFSWLFFS